MKANSLKFRICRTREILSIGNRIDLQILGHVVRIADSNIFNLDINDFDTRVMVGILAIPEAGDELKKISSTINVHK